MLPEALGMAWRPVACGKSAWDQLGKDSILHAAGAEWPQRNGTDKVLWSEHSPYSPSTCTAQRVEVKENSWKEDALRHVFSFSLHKSVSNSQRIILISLCWVCFVFCRSWWMNSLPLSQPSTLFTLYFLPLFLRGGGVRERWSRSQQDEISIIIHSVLLQN